MAGLTVAALLARDGRRVLVVEAHDTPGGYAHTFGVGAYRFCAQVHYIFACGEGETVHEVLRRLELDDTVGAIGRELDRLPPRLGWRELATAPLRLPHLLRYRTWTLQRLYDRLRMPQRPGALRDFLQLLGPEDDIARFEYLKKSARNFGSVLIGIETTAPENLARLCERLEAAGIGYRDITRDPVLAEFLI